VRRLGRILLNALTALSLVLLVATVALWVRGGWVRDTLEWHGHSADGRSYDFRAVRSARGGLQWVRLHSEGLTYTGREHGRLRWSRGPAVKYPLYDRSRPANVRGRGALGFEVVRDEAGAGAGTSPRQFWVQRTVTVPQYA
jgi:hypothetical protein